MQNSGNISFETTNIRSCKTVETLALKQQTLDHANTVETLALKQQTLDDAKQ